MVHLVVEATYAVNQNGCQQVAHLDNGRSIRNGEERSSESKRIKQGHSLAGVDECPSTQHKDCNGASILY